MIKQADDMTFETTDLDDLTGLMGRISFLRFLDEIVGKEQSKEEDCHFSVVYFNIQNFKLYNMTFGTEVGDQFLKAFADMLRTQFPGERIARFSGDHFVALTKREDLEEILTVIYEFCTKENLRIHTGIRIVDRELEGQLLCDQAKIACDALKKNAEKYYVYYSDELKEALERNLYIIENLDQAIAKGYVQVYFQPVIRALNGKLSSMEALTRWVDPERGLLTPAMFIPVLEEANLIYKLDLHVIRETGRMLRESLDQNLPVVPVSFNISRADFFAGNLFEELEMTIQKYALQREYLCVEITESILMSNKPLVMDALRKFHDAGYCVWMDDFGSGYSSLNLLKEFMFDELKIDMLFLRNLDEKGKQIIRTIVDMAKKLGIHTLAEGAETQEHVDFLREIGCEKIQGYYYGRPQPIDLLREHLQESGIEAESRVEAHLYEKAGQINVITDIPIAIFETEGTPLQMIYANPAYQEVLASIGGREEKELNAIIDQPNYAMFRKFQEFTKKVISCRDELALYYVDNGKKLRLKASTISGVQERYLIKASLENITFEDKSDDSAELDMMIRNLITLYSFVVQITPKEDRFVILEDVSNVEQVGKEQHGMISYMDSFIETRVYADDRARFRDYISGFLTEDFFEKNKKASYCNWFRIRQSNGDFKWKDITVLILKDATDSLMLCAKDAALEYFDDHLAALRRMVLRTQEMEDVENTPAQKDTHLWDELLKRSPVRFFAKDRDGHFITVSRAFMDFFGIRDASEIIGKKSEDFQLHVHAKKFQAMERAVLHKGETLRNQMDLCVSDGVIHSIIVNLFPFYRDGSVDGMFGYFWDENPLNKEMTRADSLVHLDGDTGWLNLFGATVTGNEFYKSLHSDRQQFYAILIDIPELKEMYEKYGSEKVNEILPILTERLKEVCAVNVVQARIDLSRFLFLLQTEDEQKVTDFRMQLCDEINSIHSLRGYPCTFFAQSVQASGAEVDSFDRFILMLQTKLSMQEDLRKNGRKHRQMVSLELEKFDEMENRIYLSDPDTYELLYVNYAGMKDLNLSSRRDYEGKKCFEVIAGEKSPCEVCTNSIIRRKRVYEWNYHNPLVGKDYKLCDTMAMYDGKPVHCTVGSCLSDSSMEKWQAMSYHEMVANDVISIALRESDPNMGIRKLLERINFALKARKTFIFEGNIHDKMTNTYVWDANYGSGRMARMMDLPAEVRHTMREVFSFSNEFKVKKLELIREDLPFLYQYLKDEKTDSAIAFPIRQEDEILGIMGIINPSEESFYGGGLFLRTMMRFIDILMKNRDIMQQLDSVSKRDDLTGVMNRRAYNELQANHKVTSPAAIIYADVNGLKEVNDTQGHKAGDALIRAAANVMSSLAGSEYVFRMGGDEFLIVTLVRDREEANTFCDRLLKAFEKEGLSVAIGMKYSSGAGDEINPLVIEADQRMYIMKEKMHQQMKEKKKTR
ncbi:PAS domain S-box-containing protein/diguanylate cyclase (GGDEF) domain-containing protein [Lachnospiraceae bacterium C10]|nr:PAS domain S-box-containing protein/diguanylate cyclase (GGDEF) domain-containing protein [Lachnospiraceae bacterium C10]